jgi:hypothetical protein
LGFVIFKKLPKENNRPIDEKSANLITMFLCPVPWMKSSEFAFYGTKVSEGNIQLTYLHVQNYIDEP